MRGVWHADIPLTILLLVAGLAIPFGVRAQTCCGRLDLPAAATQRGGNREHELLFGAGYEYDRLANGVVEYGFGIDAITSHRLVLTVGYGVLPWLTPELTTSFTARVIGQYVADEDQTRSVMSLSDTSLLLKFAVVGSGAYAPGALRISVAPGVKLPTGRSRQSDEYGRIPPPTQVGTGAFDGLLALYGSFGLDGEAGRWLLVTSSVGRFSNENDEGYRPGHSLELASVVQSGLLTPVALRLGPFVRLTGTDEQDDFELDASGGTFFGVRGGATYSVSDQLAFALDLQVPLVQHVRDVQMDPIVTGSVGVICSFLL
jgi:hypothetical protein